MGKIAAYHSEIAVRGSDGGVRVIKSNLDDYYTDREVLACLAAATGGNTVGEVVRAIESDVVINMPQSLLSLCIEKGNGILCTKHPLSSSLLVAAEPTNDSSQP